MNAKQMLALTIALIVACAGYHFYGLMSPEVALGYPGTVVLSSNMLDCLGFSVILMILLLLTVSIFLRNRAHKKSESTNRSYLKIIGVCGLSVLLTAVGLKVESLWIRMLCALLSVALSVVCIDMIIDCRVTRKKSLVSMSLFAFIPSVSFASGILCKLLTDSRW